MCVFVCVLHHTRWARASAIKVKTHRGDPLNEEADIRAEMGRMKEEQEKTWSVPTNRTIYQWSEVFRTKTGTWRKEHIPRKKKGDISEEGQELLEDTDKWRDRASLLKECYESRKREN